MTSYQTTLESPVGPLHLLADDTALLALTLPDLTPPAAPDARDGAGHPVLERARAELAEYFAGRRQRFDVPLAPRGTDFQRRVWAALCAIPFGATRSYGSVAAAVGQPKASRAVGLANGRNPIAIVVPCHRVIGADGSLTGYGGGLPCKEWLLLHERKVSAKTER